MSENTVRKLIEARLRVLNEVNSGKLSATSGAKILGHYKTGIVETQKIS